MYFLPFLTLKNCQRFFASGGKAVGTVNTPSSFSPLAAARQLHGLVRRAHAPAAMIYSHREQIYGPYLLKTFMNDWYKSGIECPFFPWGINL